MVTERRLRVSRKCLMPLKFGSKKEDCPPAHAGGSDMYVSDEVTAKLYFALLQNEVFARAEVYTPK